jgi:hypothetical protein
VDGGVLYALAGLFPAQGVYAAAMRAEDGKAMWRRRLDYSPQGYLLATSGTLYAPTGRGTPTAISGRAKYVLIPWENCSFYG